MAKARPSDARHRLAEPPSWVEITILVDRVRPSLLQRIVITGRRGRHGVVVALGLVGVVIALAAPAVFGTRTSGARHASNTGSRLSGPAGVAAVDGYPLPCLSVMISRENSAYARADFNRAVPCGRYDGSATAIFHRVGGSWRPAVDAVAIRVRLPASRGRYKQSWASARNRAFHSRRRTAKTRTASVATKTGTRGTRRA